VSDYDLVVGSDGRLMRVSERYPAPPYPRMPDRVREWAINVTGDVVSPSDAILHYTLPLPGHVAEWVSAYHGWSAATDRWAAALPVNEGGASTGRGGRSGPGPRGYWRMFGGAWIPNDERHPGGRGDSLLAHVKWIWGSGASDERMRAIANAVYVHRAAVREADRGLAAVLDDTRSAAEASQ